MKLFNLFTISRIFFRTSQVRWGKEAPAFLRYWRNEGKSSTHLLAITRAFYSFVCPATCPLLDWLVDYECMVTRRVYIPWLAGIYSGRQQRAHPQTNRLACRPISFQDILAMHTGRVAALKRMTSCRAVNHNKCTRSEQSM